VFVHVPTNSIVLSIVLIVLSTVYIHNAGTVSVKHVIYLLIYFGELLSNTVQGACLWCQRLRIGGGVKMYNVWHAFGSDISAKIWSKVISHHIASTFIRSAAESLVNCPPSLTIAQFTTRSHAEVNSTCNLRGWRSDLQRTNCRLVLPVEHQPSRKSRPHIDSSFHYLLTWHLNDALIYT